MPPSRACATAAAARCSSVGPLPCALSSCSSMALGPLRRMSACSATTALRRARDTCGMRVAGRFATWRHVAGHASETHPPSPQQSTMCVVA